MGTVFGQPERENYLHEACQLLGFDFEDLAKQNAAMVRNTIDLARLLMARKAGDVLDEHAAGFAEIAVKISDSLAEVARSLDLLTSLQIRVKVE